MMLDEILFAQQGQIGLITLNRPQRLNALSLAMILALQQQLILWQKDKNIHAVVLRAAPGGRAFCAGGDVCMLYSSRQHKAKQMEFFWHEYRLNHYIHHFSKPYIALIDAVVMGGGVGLALHGSHPLASEGFIFAMPETGIGFFPDIGASYLLNRCPGRLGIYLGLTGNRLGAQEALQAGLIKKIVPSAQIPFLLQALIDSDLSADAFAGVDRCIQAFSEVPAAEVLNPISPLRDLCFSYASIEKICESLQAVGGAWALETYSILAQKAPLSLKVSLAQLQRAQGLTLAQCLQMDYALAGHLMQTHDFYEGVRALLIDKDKNPQWDPPRLDLVAEDRIADYFLPVHPTLEWVR